MVQIIARHALLEGGYSSSIDSREAGIRSRGSDGSQFADRNERGGKSGIAHHFLRSRLRRPEGRRVDRLDLGHERRTSTRRAPGKAKPT